MDISRLTNDELLRLADDLAANERAAACDLIESLAEIDARKLYVNCRYTSMFDYCIYRLRMSEAATYRRIRAARALQTYPPVGPLLRSGKLTLESLVMLHPFLNDADAGALVAQAAGKRVWEVERMVAGRRTHAPRRDIVRFISPKAPEMAPTTCDQTLLVCPSQTLSSTTDTDPAPMATGAPPTDPKPPTKETRLISPNPATAPPHESILPKTADPGVRIAFTADEAFFKLLRQAQAVMRHKYPSGRLDGIFRDALQALLRRKTPWAFRAAKR